MRMLNKALQPGLKEIETFIGKHALHSLNSLEAALKQRYSLKSQLRFPFGNNYGWGYKYSHGSKHLFYLFFERGSLCATTQIGDNNVNNLLKIIDTLSPLAKEAWQQRYPCGKQGGWINLKISTKRDIDDLLNIIALRAKPKSKI